jgi:hypothetical protein
MSKTKYKVSRYHESKIANLNLRPVFTVEQDIQFSVFFVKNQFYLKVSQA